MSEWKETAIRNISSRITSGGTPSTKCPEYYGGSIPWLNTKEVNFRPINSTENSITELGLENSSAKWIAANSIIIAMYGATAGKSAIANIPLTTNQACCNITVDKTKADYKYIYYSLVDSYSELENMATGAAQQNLNARMISEFTILLPPLPEQKAIAAVLSSLDDKIEFLHRQNKTLEAMAETLFRQWFVVEADEGWEEGKLNDILEIQSGFPFKSETFTDIGSYKLVTIKAVQDGFLELNNADGISEIPPRMPQYCHLNEKDILLSLTGNVGRCCIVDKKNLLLNQRVAKIHPKMEKDRAFSYFFFRLCDTRRKLEEMAKGTAQANLSPIETGNMPMAIPIRSLLDDFSMVSTPLFDKLMKNKKLIHTLEKLRDTLLPKLMSGEVRVEL